MFNLLQNPKKQNKKEADEASIVENLSFTLSAMCSLKTSRCRFWGDTSTSQAGFVLATGTDAASENWALFPSNNIGKELVREACLFFGGLPFVWPVWPCAEPSYRRALEAESLLLRGELVAMRGTPHEGHDNMDFEFTKMTTNEDAALWAEAVWQGFGGTAGAPNTFINLAQGLCAKENFFLMLAGRNGLPVGTALISFSSSSAEIGRAHV